jgi:dipeptidase D
MMRGDCPVAGIKVTGYVTPAARFCAITGGEYTVTDSSNAEDEQGTCAFPNGATCDVWDYYRGECDPDSQADAPPPTASPSPAAASDTAATWGETATPAAAQGTAPATADATPAGGVPLKEAVEGLEPQQVWQDFYQLTQIPRPSHHEGKVREFLKGFGQDLGLETIVDDAGNVLIRKPAAIGMENRKGVILQAHMDMVPQKTPDLVHDFEQDPIEAYVDGEWVTADRTTLGADDGIGVAIAMTVLQSETLAAGPIEALFTVNEEDGMDGAQGLKPGLLTGDIYINLDWETEGAFCISSAGGEIADINTTYTEVPVPDGMAAYRLSVQGLKGGHSGVDINKGRGHATKLLVRLLKEASQEYGLRLAQMTGGSADNAIPREASAIVCVPESQADEFQKQVGEFERTVKKELETVEPDLSVQAAPADLPTRVMDEDAQGTLIDALNDTPQGVISMSDEVPGLVETSTNMGIVRTEGGKLEVTCYMRSSVDTALDDLGQQISGVWEQAGIDVDFVGRYPGWPPNPHSPILGLMQEVYKDLYGQEAGVEAVHAGLECSVIGAKYPGLDMISIGPTLQNVHTPDERLEVASVKKLTDLLLETLTRIPEK